MGCRASSFYLYSEIALKPPSVCELKNCGLVESWTEVAAVVAGFIAKKVVKDSASVFLNHGSRLSSQRLSLTFWKWISFALFMEILFNYFPF